VTLDGVQLTLAKASFLSLQPTPKLANAMIMETALKVTA
jgi:hypothetical protein